MADVQLSTGAQKLIGNTNSITHGFGPVTPTAVPLTGPTGFWGRIQAVGKVMASAFTQSEQAVSKGIGYATGANNVLNKNIQKSANVDERNQKMVSNLSAAGKLKYGVLAKNKQAIANEGSDASSQAAQNTKATEQATNTKRFIGGVVGTTADMLSGGLIKGAKSVYTAERGVQAAKAAKGANTAFLAAQGIAAGGGSSIASGASGKEAVKQAAKGAAVPLGAAIIGKIFRDGPAVLLSKLKSGEKNVGVVKAKDSNMRDVMTNDQANTVMAPTRLHVTDQTPGSHNIEVTAPVRPGIKQISTTDKINVRTPIKMSDPQFHSEFNKLSDAYNKETKQLQISSKLLSPKQSQVISDKLEQRYQSKLNDLQDRYHNPEMSAPKTPTSLNKTTLPAEKTTGGVLNPTKDNLSPVTNKLPAEKTTSPNSYTANIDGQAKTAGSSIKISKESIQKGLTARMEGLPEFAAINKKDQAAKVTDLINNNRQKAEDIISGKINAPDGIHPIAVHNGLVELARKEGNGELMTKLAQSQYNRELSESGQKLSLAAERDPHNPVEQMRQISNIRTAIAEKRLGTTAYKAISTTAKQIEQRISKPGKNDWHMFIESIRCK